MFVRGSREGWANDFTPFHEGIRCSLSSSSVGHARGIIYSLITRAEELLDYMLLYKHLMRPHAQFTWHAPSHGQMARVPHPAAPQPAQLLHCSMCCVPWRQQQPDANALFRQLDQAWQGASPLQRRLAAATGTSLRRPPHPLRCTGAAQHHLSPMRALSAKRLLSVA